MERRMKNVGKAKPKKMSQGKQQPKPKPKMRMAKRYARGNAQIGRIRLEGHDKPHSFSFHFHPASANVTVGGSGAYIAGQGIMTGPGASALDATFAIVSSMNDLSSISDLQELFDVYRIRSVQYNIIPLGTVQPTSPSLQAATTVSVRPQGLITVIDQDDATPLSTLGQALQYESFKYTRSTIVHKRRFSPRVGREIFDGVTAAYEEPDKPVWVDCAEPQTPHYGLKLWVDTAGATANCQNQWRIFGRMDIDFKRVR